MNEENIISNESGIENSESRNVEKEKLDDATNEPRSFIEQNGDYEQAEAIQKALEELPIPCCPPGDLPNGSGVLVEEGEIAEMDNPLENESKVATGPEMRDISDEEVEMGPVKQPLDWDHGIPADRIKTEDKNTVLGRIPKVRDDLSEATLSGSGDGKDEATPINLPGPQPANEEMAPSYDGVNVGEAPEPGPHPFPNVAIEDDGSGGRMAEVDLSPDDVKFKNEGSGSVAGHKEPGDPPPPPDQTGQTVLSPDDVKLEGDSRGDNIALSPDDVKITDNSNSGDIPGHQL